MKEKFVLKSKFKPAGDQPSAIKGLISGLKKNMRHQTLFGATGTGKTFTVANIIEHIQKPTLVIAHNKTLAAQLAQEYRDFFPDNAVHYFVSYYDYYQPEAYMATTDTYIEKEAQINDEIQRLRHASTQSLLTRSDVIVVASVSCIYGLGSPEEYENTNLKLEVGMSKPRGELVRGLVDVFYERTNADLEPGLFRAVGNAVEVMPVNEKTIFRIEYTGSKIVAIIQIDAITRSIISEKRSLFLFPAKHYVTSDVQRQKALSSIEKELQERLKEFEESGMLLEHERLKRRTRYDLAMIREIGYTNGIENYSRHLDGRAAGEPAHTLLSFFPHTEDGAPDFLTIIDESHVTVPQLSGMYAGDRSRKDNLVQHGFRLPSARDNRPLQFDEFQERTDQTIYTTATPGKFELEHSEQIVEQVIRPTGLLDPQIEIKPVVEKGVYKGQVQDFIEQAGSDIKKGGRVLATTLTKRMAEDLSEYLEEKGMRSQYLHSEVSTLERIEILTNFRKGEFDVLVGVNLLREGLDLPEVSLIGILDADKEGFLRSETALIQTIGRAARNVDGRVILYADQMTGSIERAVGETNRRREKQLAYNRKHKITPKTIKKAISDITDQLQKSHDRAVGTLLSIDEERFVKNPRAVIREKEQQMVEAVKILDFETAAILRDEIKVLEERSSGKKKKGPKKRQK